MNPFKKIWEKTFAHGQETVAKDIETGLFQEQTALNGRAAQAASDAIDLAGQLESEGDPYKK